VTLAVNPVNDAPVASPDAAITNEDFSVTIPVLDNDSDVDGDALVVTALTMSILLKVSRPVRESGG